MPQKIRQTHSKNVLSALKKGGEWSERLLGVNQKQLSIFF